MNLKMKMFFLTSIMLFFMSMVMLYKKMFLSLELDFFSMIMMSMSVSIIMDWTSLMFMSTVLMISSMVMLFSTEYMPNSQHNMFIIMMMMFILSMIMLIISDNIVFILLGWDGLGMSSYALVIFYQDWNSSASGSITLISNRLGDIMILMSIGIMFSMTDWSFCMNKNFSMMLMMLIVIAAMTKSAQFPFSAWLPAAMSAPTPISALVHSSTLVTAGVFILIRTMNIYHPMSMSFLMIISSMTAMYSSMSALWQKDMKKIIALSTLSQMAMMMFAISMNATNIAYFHLIIHALFKSMMFLCAGIMIHNFTYQDMRHMGSTMKNSPFVLSMLGISNMSLMGIPFMSGFFSKDSIIENLLNSNHSLLLSMMMLFSIALTTMYSLQMMVLSSNFFMKSNTNLLISTSNYMSNSVNNMMSFSVLMGAMMLWMWMPFQIMMIPTMMKICIISMIFLGIIISFTFPMKMIKMGQSAISLWFNHIMLTKSINIFKFNMNQNFYTDKKWQEIYGPQNLYYNIKISSKYPETMISSSLSLIMLMLMLPMTIIMLK